MLREKMSYQLWKLRLAGDVVVVQSHLRSVRAVYRGLNWLAMPCLLVVGIESEWNTRGVNEGDTLTESCESAVNFIAGLSAGS